MLPYNVRVGDFVEVSNRNNPYFGMIGRIKQLKVDKVTVDIYGKQVEIDREDLTLKARIGTRSHDDFKQQIRAQKLTNLDELGYDVLINFAIDCEDWEWAKDLVERKNKLVRKNKLNRP